MRRRSSIRTRLTWAFLLVAVGSMALVMFGFNVAFWSTVEERIESGRGIRGNAPISGTTPAPGQATGGYMLNPSPSQPGSGKGTTVIAPGGVALRISIWEALYEGRQLAFQVSILAGALGLVIAAIVSYLVAERLTRSMRRLADAARSPRPLPDNFSVSREDPEEMVDLAGALSRMTDRLQKEDEARRNLFADIAHELRHPIALLRGRLEMMQDGVTPVTPEGLSALQDEVIRLGRLVADVRELSLAEVGTLSLNLQTIDLAEEIAVTQENFEPIAADKQIQLLVQTDPLPPVTADPDRIRQVLANLLSNAIRHAPQNGKVNLRAVQRGEQVAIMVEDTGTGIAPEDLEHIFDRFYRADKSRTRSTGGTGLGLAIARGLARIHGGDLTAENIPGGGARFTLTVPVTASRPQAS